MAAVNLDRLVEVNGVMQLCHTRAVNVMLPVEESLNLLNVAFGLRDETQLVEEDELSQATIEQLEDLASGLTSVMSILQKAQSQASDALVSSRREITKAINRIESESTSFSASVMKSASEILAFLRNACTEIDLVIDILAELEFENRGASVVSEAEELSVGKNLLLEAAQSISTVDEALRDSSSFNL